MRDWLFVEDHCRAIKAVLKKGAAGEIYNIGGNCSLPNLEVIHRILTATGKPSSLITSVADRPGHDRRYALTNDKLTNATGWQPEMDANGALTATITETDSATPGTHTVTLTGTAVTPGPAATSTPSTLTFAKQNVGSTSAAQGFSVTNTGSANLNISTIVSTTTAEFPVYNDGCSGTTLAPNARCVVSVQFSPTLGGSRTGSIKITDTASGSPQTVALTGTGCVNR